MITIKENNPTPKVIILRDVITGELFRFKGTKGVCLKLQWSGDDYLAVYKYAENGIKSMFEDVEAITECLYFWDSEELDRKLDKEYYQDNPEEFRAYYDFSSKSIQFSAYNEEVELLNGELTVSLA